MKYDRSDTKQILAKVPIAMQERLLSMIKSYFSYKDASDQFYAKLDIEFFMMRFWQRGLITASECCVLLEDLD